MPSQAFAPKLMAAATDGEINIWAHELSAQTGLRVTVISPDGIVFGESDKPPDQLLSSS